MRLIKKVNNNIALGFDGYGRELVAIGKGIGFPQMPYELTDLSLIDRTYYGFDEKYLGLFQDIPEAIFEVSAKIVDKAKLHLPCDLNPNLIFTLADHLAFAIDRYKQSIDIRNPLSYDIEHLYTAEIAVGHKALEYIKKYLHITLPQSEAASIALHLVNAEAGFDDMNSIVKVTKITAEVTKIVEECFHVDLDPDSFNYSRFIIHLRYLIMRRQNNDQISSDNKLLYDYMKVKYPNTYKCITRIESYFLDVLDWDCSEEELLYLMLHINRLCTY